MSARDDIAKAAEMTSKLAYGTLLTGNGWAIEIASLYIVIIGILRFIIIMVYQILYSG